MAERELSLCFSQDVLRIVLSLSTDIPSGSAVIDVANAAGVSQPCNSQQLSVQVIDLRSNPYMEASISGIASGGTQGTLGGISIDAEEGGGGRTLGRRSRRRARGRVRPDFTGSRTK